MAHTHSHDHTGKAISRLWFTFFLNLGISVAQLIGGFLSNSMALISDAVHNLSDTGSVGVSLVARKYANKSADKQMTFGYRRADIIGAFINLIILIGVSLFLVKEGIERFLQPEGIHVDLIKDELESISHVRDVHHIHVWKVDEHQKMLECHAHIDKSYSSLLEEIKSEIKACLSDRFDITHSAIEFELEPCESSTHHS